MWLLDLPPIPTSGSPFPWIPGEVSSIGDLWAFLLRGYVLTVLLETPVLLWLLDRSHPLRRRLFAGLWLTACTYPVVVLVLPMLISHVEQRLLYLLVAETFAPAAECLLFALAFHLRSDLATKSRLRDYAAIVIANLLSFGVGEALHRLGISF